MSGETAQDATVSALRGAVGTEALAVVEGLLAVGVQWYLYARDLAALRDHLVFHGQALGVIVDGSPGPKQEMRLADPDGYVLMVALIDAVTVVGE